MQNTNFFRSTVTAMAMVLLAGCATTTKPTNPMDPYENFNRQVFKFNMAVDDVIFTPITETYVTIVPKPIQTGVHNFLSNIGEVPTVANDLLQAKFAYALADGWRFVINSTIGFFGVFDIAEKMGLKKHYEDFGLTLAHWGATKSPYIMLPFLGPSTVRDTIGLPINYYFLSIYPHIKSQSIRYGLVGLDVVDIRATLLPGHKLIKKAFDPYVFVRNAYFQHRKQLINNNVVAKGKAQSEATYDLEPEQAAPEIKKVSASS